MNLGNNQQDALVAGLTDIVRSTQATIEVLMKLRVADSPRNGAPEPTRYDDGINEDFGEARDDYAAASPTPGQFEEVLVRPQRVIPWGAHVSREFIDSCLWIEDQIGLKVENLMPCMKFESNLNPQAKNPYSSGSGLIQFMESTAKRLGTTTARLRAMSAVTQLSYVYRYFKEYADRGFDLSSWSLEDTYMSILWPAGIGKDPSYRVFVNDPNKLKDAYDVNKGLDLNKDGFITKAEACAKVVKLAAEGTSPQNAGFI